MPAEARNVLALTGGVGGAKLALGLADCLAPEALHLVANTGDDFEHLGLHISPDIDTLIYTLAGLSNPQQGWGLDGETFHALEALGRLGGETWFRLGDRDLATHLWRSCQLAAGQTLQEVTAALARSLGVAQQVYPMCNEAVRTNVHCEGRVLPFQRYFVGERCAPPVSGFAFDGIERAAPVPALRQLLDRGAFAQVVICPSNPFVSIDPILQVPGLWQALREQPAPVTLVSPIVAGAALKGPAAKMMAELGVPASATGVAQHYARRYPGLLDHFVIDHSDGTLAADIAALGMQAAVTSTVMTTREHKRALAQFVLRLVESER
ncbi:MAG: 2-phospho-L-lactate transferase [Halioglobus sp.]|nr:2-phospho-L-lactate transferase [Halioglobus sp.]